MVILSLRDLEIKDKNVLMRVDFNVPLNNQGEIEDDTRIRQTLPSIRYILDHHGKLILMSHLGRPKGKKDPKLSLKPIAKRLSELLGKPVEMVSDCIGSEAESLVQKLKNGDVLLLENLRFHEAEENPEKDPSFVKKLASLGDVFVNDAFGSAHRAHASTTQIASYFKSKSALGFLMEKEMTYLSKLVQNPKHPFYAIIGGAKVGSKIGVLNSLSEKIDGFFIGGGMAFTFLKARGISIGDSLYEEEQIETAKKFLHSNKVFLPEDVVIADEFTNNANQKIISTKDGIPGGWRGMDIGPKTLQSWSSSLSDAKTIFWNGPMGVFEFSEFAKGTQKLAQVLGNLSCTSIVGGGDSVAAINAAGLQKNFTYLSTGGGASLEFIEFGHLPGIDALCRN